MLMVITGRIRHCQGLYLLGRHAVIMLNRQQCFLFVLLSERFARVTNDCLGIFAHFFNITSPSLFPYQ